ncbi:Protein phosphatase 1 regulatory subunit 3D [Tulasnella sp. 403]|nr:Protein phosphatase 1 regulatory subunit 3D [Tulasnella sp. 403]
MPYTPPGVPKSPSAERNHHRGRSFSEEVGPGAFAPIEGLPRRSSSRSSIGVPKLPTSGTQFPSPANTSAQQPATASPTPTRTPKFQLPGSSDDDDDDDDDDHSPLAQNGLPAKMIANATGNGRLTVTPPPLAQIPFPTSSPASSPIATTHGVMMGRSSSTPQIHSPKLEDTPPSIYRSPYSSLKSEPNSRLRVPLKPALKSNHSSPHLPSLAHQRSLTQSAPSTPNLTQTTWEPSTSTPGTPASTTYSVPQTPKQVHFSSENLESVVVFAKGARPRSLSNPGGNDTETETEGYDSEPSWGGRYPFPAMPPSDEKVILINEDFTSRVPSSSSEGTNGYSSTGGRHFVYLETLMLPGTKPPTLRGSVLVRNVAFQKRVAVRFTMDDWQTTSEVACGYTSSLPSLPPPFSSSSHMPGHSKSASVAGYPSASPSSSPPLSNGGKSESWDRFTFTIKLEDVERSLASKKLLLAVRYQLPSQWGWETGGEWWDNNDMKNYEIHFKVGKKPTSTSGVNDRTLSALAARTSASFRHDEMDSLTTSRTNSLPPLPAPGAVRPPPSPLSLSPSNSSTSLGLTLNKKPVLPPLSGLKLRPGRGPTFTDVSPKHSPPGSPARSTMYIPPLPGTVPGSPAKLVRESSSTVSPTGSALIGSSPAPISSPSVSVPVQEKEPEATKVEAQPAPKGPGLTISTTGFFSVGKKRGLSLSNYASPSSIKSPSSTSPTVNGAGSMQNLAALLGAHTEKSMYGGGDGGENAYVYGRPGRYDSSSTTSTGPITPGSGSELKIIGGMPATVIDEPFIATSTRNSLLMPSHAESPTPPRVPSWEVPLNGFWTGVGMPHVNEGFRGLETKKPPSMPASEDVEEPLLPTPPDSSANSSLSTPDLERSPEQGEHPVMEDDRVSNEDDQQIGLEGEKDRNTPTPTLTTAGPTSFVPFPSSSPVTSSDEGRTVRVYQASPPPVMSSQSSSSSDSDSDRQMIEPPLSNLAKRMTEQTGRAMKLEMPARPKFKAGRGSDSGSGREGKVERGSPSEASAGWKATGKRSPPRRTTSPVPGATGLGLNLTSPGSTNGPPAEFLAKYCFFASSPSAGSPPSSTGASTVTSPSHALSAAFGQTGIDTPRASSPGLASGVSWWGYGSPPDSAIGVHGM